MPNYICTTCGTQHTEGEQPPSVCAVCQVVADRKHISFMYSYPNYVPLSAAAVERIVKAVEPFEYERVYGAFWDTVIHQDGKAAVGRSAEQYRQRSRAKRNERMRPRYVRPRLGDRAS
ncbi:MAG TPA: hypothetical protein VN688_00095 [Gemmataceae bacterium]|nr:hypothetical protein [Gemmataceae bacterium]